jgi:hypothetical protein
MPEARHQYESRNGQKFLPVLARKSREGGYEGRL